MSQGSYRKGRDSIREPTINDRESAMATVITCHNCERPGQKNKDCNKLNKKTDKYGNPENSKTKWCPYVFNDNHSNEDSYKQ